jgi:hypothetical protein
MRRKPIFIWSAGAVAAALLSAVTPAGAIDAPEPGLWSIVTRIGQGNRQIPVHKIDQCITAEEARTFAGDTAVEWTGKDRACTSTDYRKTDNGGIVQVHCTGNVALDATLSYTLKSPQHYIIVFAATAPSTGQATTWTRTVEGRRLGECAK